MYAPLIPEKSGRVLQRAPLPTTILYDVLELDNV